MNPEISVIVPAYNVEKYLAECLESIINQTFKGFEIIVVDDCSSDLTSEIINNYYHKESRLHIYKHAKNMGLGEARNTGIKNAKGNYICFVDSDDIIDPGYLQLMYDSIKTVNASMVICGMYQFIDGNKEVLIVRESVDHTQVIKTDYAVHLYLTPNWNNIVIPSACNKLIDANVLRGIDFPNRYFEDLDTVLRIILASDKIVLLNQILYYYRTRMGSISREISEKHVCDHLAAVYETSKLINSARINIHQKTLNSYLAEKVLYNILDEILKVKNIDNLQYLLKIYRAKLFDYKLSYLDIKKEADIFYKIILNLIERPIWNDNLVSLLRKMRYVYNRVPQYFHLLKSPSGLQYAYYGIKGKILK